jgi:type II secretory ATPase GspE/PulE/Tfp pilus assembly ATPase PilB-like protein
VLHEVLDFEGALRAPLERGANAAAIREAAASLGFPSLSERGAQLVRQGLTTRREVERALGR